MFLNAIQELNFIQNDKYIILYLIKPNLISEFNITVFNQ